MNPAASFRRFLILFAPLVLAACGDDDGQTNQNNLNNNSAAPVCGNGAVETGEQCDQGAANSDSAPDGCRTDCRPAYCGDGVKDTGETCDDQALAGLDCTTIPGSTFTGGVLGCTASCEHDTSQCFTCGDGNAEPGEACDGFDTNSQDCGDVTEFQQGTLLCHDDCTFDTSGCHTCGNLVAEGSEVCDGLDLKGVDCTDLGQGFTGGVLACTACAFDTAQCATCGNGVVEPGEACDEDDLAGESCDSVTGKPSGQLACAADCTFDTGACYRCGDGVAEGEESCDGTDLREHTCTDGTLDGHAYYGGALACDACTMDLRGCAAAGRCGDLTVQPAHEACDVALGTVFDCPNLGTGYTDGSYKCLGCQWDLSRCTTCGDGVIEPANESCDDGNGAPWDGCRVCRIGVIDLPSDNGTPPETPHFAGWGATRSALAADGRAAVISEWMTGIANAASGMIEQLDQLELHAWFLDSDGQPMGDRLVVAASPGGYDQAPALGFATDGRLLTVWSTCSTFEASTLSFGDCSLMARWYTDQGAEAGAPFELDSASTSDRRDPAVAVDALSGRMIVLWMEERASPVGSVVRAQWFDADGALVALPFDVSEADDRLQIQPTGAFDASGRLLVVWSAVADGLQNGSLLARRYDATGAPLGAIINLTSGLSELQLLAQVAIDSGGTALVAHDVCSPALSCSIIRVVELTSQGTVGQVAIVASGLNERGVERVSIISPALDEYTVAWVESGPGGSNLMRRHLGAAAALLDAAAQIDLGQHPTDQYYLSHAMPMLAGGSHLVSWVGHSTQGATTTVTVQRFAADESPLGSLPW